MGLYKIKIAGRRAPLYLKAANKTEATAAVAEATLLTADEMLDAMAEGVTLWKVGEPVPADDPEPEAKGEAAAEPEA